MRVLRTLQRRIKASVITVGMFDGVHRGHQKILKALVLEARKAEVPAVVITFAKHPQSVMHRGLCIPMISTFEQKKALLEALGVDVLINVAFDRRFARISPQRFVKEMLCGRMGMRMLCVGYDFVFGRGRKGNLGLLRSLAADKGFRLRVFGPYRDNKGIISSTAIRRKLALGDVATAARLLGRPYAVRGRVMRGLGLGKQLGFPTCNLSLENDSLLPDGVYAVGVRGAGIPRPGALNVGVRPTLGKAGARIWEVHIPGIDKNLYGKDLEIFFLKRLRSERKFLSLNALKRQIGRDVMRAKGVFKSSIRRYNHGL